MFNYERRLKRNARVLRKRMTDAEVLLWMRLRGKQLRNTQFYRQKPLGPYIVDFYAATARLVVELDGSQHFEGDGPEQDAVRDAALAAMDILVLRFDNHQVLSNLDGVLNAIDEALEARRGGGASNPP